MPKIIQNFIVGIRHGGDTCYVTESVIVGAKSQKDAIEYAKQEKGKHHHYSCERAEISPAVRLSEGVVTKRSFTGSPFVEIDNEIYLETDEIRKAYGTDKNGEPTLTVERKYVKRFARKESDCLWKVTSQITGSESIAIHLKYSGPDKPRRKQLRHHPMNLRR